MSDLGKQGGQAGVHESGPVTDGFPVEVATTKAPEGMVVFGTKTEGIGSTNPGAR